MDLNSRRGGADTITAASQAPLPLELPAGPYAEPLTVKVDATGDKVTAPIQILIWLWSTVLP